MQNLVRAIDRASSQRGNQKYSLRKSIWMAISSTNAAMLVAIPGIPLSGETRTMPTMSSNGPNDLLPIVFTIAPREICSPASAALSIWSSSCSRFVIFRTIR